MAAKEQVAMILKVPISLSTLVRINVPCSIPLEAKEVHADLMSLAADARASAIQQLNTLQPGGALVATPGAQDGEIQIVCHKGLVGKVYKALLAKQVQLGIDMQKVTVKSSVCLAAMSSQQLQAPLKQALKHTLTASGWASWQGEQLIGCNFLEATPGRPCTTVLLDLSVHVQLPATVLLVLHPELVRFRPLSLAAPGNAVNEEVRLDADSLEGLNRAAAGTPCCILPSLRPAWVEGVLAGGPEASIPEDVRALCKSILGALPRPPSLLYWVRLWQDDDSPTAEIPACCVWNMNGLSTLPVKPGDYTALLQRLQGDICRSECKFWSGQPLVVQSTGVCVTTQALTEVADGLPTWQSASTLMSSSAKELDPKALLSGGGIEVDGFTLRDGSTSKLRGFLPARDPSAAKILKAALARQFPIAAAAALPLEPPKLPRSAAAPPGTVNTPKLLSRRPMIAGRATPTAPQAAKLIKPTLATIPEEAGAAPLGGPSGVPPLDIPEPPALQKLVSRKAATGLGRPADKPKAAAKPKAAPTAKRKPAIVFDATAARQPAAAGAKEPVERKQPEGVPELQIAREANVGEQVEQQVAQAAGLKDTLADTAAPLARKRTKAADLDYTQVEAKVWEKAAQGKLSDLTIPEMKCFLKGRKLAVLGKKADLVARVGEAMASMP